MTKARDEKTSGLVPILGIDIGGTKISVCLGTASGEIIESKRFPTDVLKGPDDACKRIKAAVDEIVRGSRIHDVIGVAAPGPLSSREGRFINPPNMPTWHDFPIKYVLEQKLGRKVRLMNDANAAAAAEWIFGAGAGCETMVFFTMSTGMGAGIVIGGRLHEGPDDLAGEVGHIRVAPDGPVGFGRRGSLEGFCSGPGIAQIAVMKLMQALHAQKTSALFDLDKDYRLIDAKDVGEAARQGDSIAIDTFREVGQRLGEFSSLMVDILNPDAIVLGTIGRLYFDLISPSARAEIDKWSHPAAARRVKLLPGALGDKTGDLAAICAAVS